MPVWVARLVGTGGGTRDGGTEHAASQVRASDKKAGYECDGVLNLKVAGIIRNVFGFRVPHYTKSISNKDLAARGRALVALAQQRLHRIGALLPIRNGDSSFRTDEAAENSISQR